MEPPRRCLTIIAFVLCKLCVLLSVADAAFAVTYWVSPTGAAANLAACSGATPLSGTSACSYDKANGSEVIAGDTVYYRSGTYTNITGSVIAPYNTGRTGNVITFSAYNNEDVEFVSSSTATATSNRAISFFYMDGNNEPLNAKGYFRVHGMKFRNFMYWCWIGFSTHNEISHCTFTGYPSSADANSFSNFAAFYVHRGAYYNWVHDCVIGTWGYNAIYGDDIGAPLHIGVETPTANDIAKGYYTQYNLLENNVVFHGGHHAMGFGGAYNVYRNNYVYNDPWYPVDAPIYATRTGYQVGGGNGVPSGTYNLAEYNRIAYGGPKNKAEIGGSGVKMSGNRNIWRFNSFVQVYTNAMLFEYYPECGPVVYNHVYNNTFWHGGYGRYQYYPSGTVPSANWDDVYTHAIAVDEGVDGLGTNIHDNVFKNNIFYQNSDRNGTAYSLIREYAGVIGKSLPTHQVLSSNWMDSAGDPKFMDISGTPDPTNRRQWNLRLQSGSPCIDGGTFLTTITSASGSGTSFTVADAGYFFDGWGIGAQIPNARIAGDTIQLAGQTESAVITAVNYAANTITVDKSLSWTNGQGIGLAFKGTAPDYGAFEYDPDAYTLSASETYASGSFWGKVTSRTYTYQVQSPNYSRDTVTKVTQDGIALVKQGSVDLCEVTRGSYFVNVSDGTLYVHSTDDADPGIHTIKVTYH